MKRFTQQFFKGLKAYSRALDFISKNKLRHYFLFPFIFIVLFFTGSMGASAEFTAYANSWIHTNLLTNTETWYYPLLNGVVFTLIWLILKIVFFFIFAYIGGFLIMMVLSPLFSMLSERVEQITVGSENPFRFQQLIKDVFRGIALSLRNLLYELIFMVIALFLSLIPVVGWISPVLLFFISAYFYGFSFMDYTNERRRLNVKQSVADIRQNKGLAIGIGFLFSLSLLIPVVGVFFSAFVAVVAVVAATLVMIEENE